MVQFTLAAYPPSTGGAQIHTHRLVRALVDGGRAVGVAAFWDRSRTDWLAGTTLGAAHGSDWSFEGVTVKRLGMTFLRRLAHLPFLPLHYPFPRVTTPIFSRLLQSDLERAFPEATEIVHHVRIGREILARASLSIARRRGVPFVLTPLHHPRWTGWRYLEWCRIYRTADHLFALTEAEGRTLQALGVEADRITVCGHAPSLAPALRTESSPVEGSTNPTVLFLGQHYAYKGWRQLLQAAPLVWERRPEARFVFAGPDVGDSGKAFRGLDPRIERLGPVDEATKARLLAECSMLVLPSTQESFGGVFTEAWSFGKPVIGCPIPAVSELVEEGRNGLLRPQEPSALAEGILRLLDDPVLASRMGGNGRALVVERFTWPIIAAKVEAGYRLAQERVRARDPGRR